MTLKYSKNLTVQYHVARRQARIISIVTRPWAGHLRQFLGPTQPHTVGTGAFSLGIKWLGLEVQYSLLCNVEVKNVWSHTYTLTYACMACIERFTCTFCLNGLNACGGVLGRI